MLSFFFIGKGVIIHQPTGIVGELAGENPVALAFGPWQNLEIKKSLYVILLIFLATFCKHREFQCILCMVF